MLRYLFGPVTKNFAEANLQSARAAGACLCFDSCGQTDVTIGPADSWADVMARLPGGWRPDAVVLYMPYTRIPSCLWSAPVPIVGLAADWNLLWSWYRGCLWRCDLVLTDALGVEVMQRAGIRHVRQANLFGLDASAPLAENAENAERDIDVLFCGNLHPAAQGERLPWLERVARLGERWNVQIHSGVFGEAYWKLMRRARIVFNRSVRGECNKRALEAAAAGALLCQESENVEIRAYFRGKEDISRRGAENAEEIGSQSPFPECVLYDEHNLEELLEYYLEHKEERKQIAEAGRRRVGEYTFEKLWERQVVAIEEEWEVLEERARKRVAGDVNPRNPAVKQAPNESLYARVWEVLSSGQADAELARDLAGALIQAPHDAGLHNALGVIEQPGNAAVAAGHFGRAADSDPQNVLAGLNLAEALAVCGKREAAVEQARRTAAVLNDCAGARRILTRSASEGSGWSPCWRGGLQCCHADVGCGTRFQSCRGSQDEDTIGIVSPNTIGIVSHAPGRMLSCDGPHFPTGFDFFRVEWERAGWMYAGLPEREAEAKLRLVKWRLSLLLAELTGDVAYGYEAVLARPDLPVSRAVLGVNLLRAGRAAESIAHLREAVCADPFDNQAARLLFQAYGAAQRGLDQRRLARERRRLLRAAPQAVQADAWITQCPPVGDELVSIIILCCNQVEYTRQCLESVLRHTRPPYELVLVDNGSTDGTAEYLAEIGRRLGGPGLVGASERRQSIARDVSPWRADGARGASPERATVAGCEPDAAALPGLKHNDAAVVPGAHAAWLSTAAPPGLKTTNAAAPPGLRPGQSTAGRLGTATGVHIIRNETNVGFPAGCNQGLQRARGRYVIFLNNDTIVTEGWLEGLVRWSLFEWPKVGMVGPVTNFSSPPQQIGVDYQELSGLAGFAVRQRNKFANQAQRVERLTGFCLLVRREVLDKIGGFDERFGLGFFDDDDLCVRARQAGFELLLAQDVFVHHFGNRTFQGLGVNCREQLTGNFERFKAKWGEERVAGYLLIESTSRRGAEDAEKRENSCQGEGAESTAVSSHGTPESAGSECSCSALSAPLREALGVSLCMIVRNEEHNLAACLESTGDLFAEKIIVDTGSADRTKEIAAGFGARVFDFAWVDSFATARNECLRHATGRWIMWLDADDRLDEENRTRLRALFAGLKDENAAYAMKCLCLPDPVSGTATVVDHVRLFPNHADIRWKYRVHEQILPAVRLKGGEVRWADVVIQHVGYQDAALRRRKLERDLRLLHLENAEHPDDPFTLFNLGCVFQELGQVREALPLLERSLARSQPGDSIVRKLYALIVQCHRQLGEHEQALAACKTGQQHYPQDCELLFQEGLVRREHGDRVGAERCFLHLMEHWEGSHFASLDTGLRSHKARHNLAVLYREQGRLAEAEAQWRAALAEQPQFTPAVNGLRQLRDARQAVAS